MGTFINQACLVKMAGYWPRSLLCFFLTLTSSWSIKTQGKLGKYAATVYLDLTLGQ